jgi:hypothetical protein
MIRHWRPLRVRLAMRGDEDKSKRPTNQKKGRGERSSEKRQASSTVTTAAAASFHLAVGPWGRSAPQPQSNTTGGSNHETSSSPKRGVFQEPALPFLSRESGRQDHKRRRSRSSDPAARGTGRMQQKELYYELGLGGEHRHRAARHSKLLLHTTD